MSMLKRSYSDFSEAKLNGIDVVDEASRKRQNTGISNGHMIKAALDSGPVFSDTVQSGNPDAGRDHAQILQNGPVHSTPMTCVDKETEETGTSTPPQIVHVTQGLSSLRTLIARLSQDTFNGLNDIVSEVATFPNTESADSENAFERKKARLWQFLQDRRAKYIKMIVIAQWSRKAPIVSKYIDAYSWQVSQRRILQEATNWLGEMKRLLFVLKTHRPQLSNALSLLSTGADIQIGGLGFVSKQDLSAKQTLRGIQNLNSLLVIRLNSEKNIKLSPLQYRVANGRVTISLPNEFDLDLTIGNRDTNAHFHFLDLRLNFDPCRGSLSSETILFEMRWRLNQLLATGGLDLCFKELRNVVLTHRLSILRQQGLRLIQEGWGNDLHIEWAHRELVVQYWTTRPGLKSWLEIGIAKQGLKIRWFLQGRRMKVPETNTKLADSSLQKILETITAAHCSHIFACAKSNLRSTVPFASKYLAVRHRRSRRLHHSSLVIELLKGTILTINISPSSGQISVLPLTGLTRSLQLELNRLTKPSDAFSKVLMDYRGKFMIEQASEIAQSAEWTPMSDLRLNSETSKRLFGPSLSHYVFYKMGRKTTEWLVALTITDGLVKWWVVRHSLLGEHEQTATQVMLGQNSAFRLSLRIYPLPGSDLAGGVRKVQDLEYLGTAAILLVTRWLDEQDLHEALVSYQIITSRNPRTSEGRFGGQGCCGTTLKSTFGRSGAGDRHRVRAYKSFPIIKISLLNLLEAGEYDSTVWKNSSVLGFQGSCDAERSTVTVQYFGCLAGKVTILEVVKNQLRDSFLVDRKTGNFRMDITTSFGCSTIRLLKQSLLKLQDLINLLTSLKSAGLHYNCANLDLIQVVYAEHEDFKAEAVILIGPDRKFRIKVGPNDPYRALQPMLDQQVDLASCESLLKLMQTNFTLARSLQTVCSSTAGHMSQPMVFAKNLSTYEVKYKRPGIRYNICSEYVKSDIVSILTPTLDPADELFNPADFWSEYLQSRTIWTGLQNAVIVPRHSVMALINDVQEKWQNLAQAMALKSKQGLEATNTDSDEMGVVMID